MTNTVYKKLYCTELFSEKNCTELKTCVWSAIYSILLYLHYPSKS